MDTKEKYLILKKLKKNVNLTASRLANFKKTKFFHNSNMGLFSNTALIPLLRTETGTFVDDMEKNTVGGTKLKEAQASFSAFNYFEVMGSRVFEATQYLKTFCSRFPEVANDLREARPWVDFRGFSFDIFVTREELEEIEEQVNDIFCFLEEVEHKERYKTDPEETLFHFSTTYQHLYDKVAPLKKLLSELKDIEDKQ